jgi:hypothetical protein
MATHEMEATMSGQITSWDPEEVSAEATAADVEMLIKEELAKREPNLAKLTLYYGALTLPAGWVPPSPEEIPDGIRGEIARILHQAGRDMPTINSLYNYLFDVMLTINGGEPSEDLLADYLGAARLNDVHADCLNRSIGKERSDFRRADLIRLRNQFYARVDELYGKIVDALERLAEKSNSKVARNAYESNRQQTLAEHASMVSFRELATRCTSLRAGIEHMPFWSTQEPLPLVTDFRTPVC